LAFGKKESSSFQINPTENTGEKARRIKWKFSYQQVKTLKKETASGV